MAEVNQGAGEIEEQVKAQIEQNTAFFLASSVKTQGSGKRYIQQSLAKARKRDREALAEGLEDLERR